MAEGKQYNLGININVQQTNVNQQLDRITNRFQDFDREMTRVNQHLNQLSIQQTDGLAQEERQYRQLQGEVQKITKEKKQLSQQNVQLQDTVGEQDKRIKQLNKTIKQQSKVTNQATNSNKNWLSSYSKSLKVAIYSTGIWALATTSIYGTIRALRDMHQVTMDVNSEMVALRRVMNESLTDFVELQSSAADLGVDFATNVNEVVQSMVSWGRQGKEQIEVIQLTEAALLAKNVAQMEAKESVELLTAAILQFNKDASEAIEIVDRLNEVANNYATTAQNLAMSIRESGSASENAGVSMDELIGITTALSAATAKTGNRIGRTIRTVFSRMMGDAQDSGEALGQVEATLNSVGIALRVSEDQYRSLTDVLTDVSLSWNELDEVMQANIARAMGGRRQYSDVISLIENWDIAMDATQTSMDSLGSAMRENEIYMQSMQAQWDQARAEFERTSLILGDLATNQLSIKLANALQNTYSRMGNVLVGLGHLEEKFNLVTGATVLLSAALSYKLIPAIAKVSSVIWAHPLLTAGLLGTGALVTYINHLGEVERQLEKAKKERDAFNDVLERGNELSLEEISNVDNIISKYTDLVNQYNVASEALKQFEDIDGAFWSARTKAGQALNIFGDLLFGKNETLNKWIELSEKEEEAISSLRNLYPELSEEFEDHSQFIKAAGVELANLQDEMQSTISWISKYSVQKYEETKQNVRANKILQDTIDTYFSLANASELSTLEQAKLQSITRDLMRDFPELSANMEDFDEILKSIQEESEDEFGKFGTQVTNVIKEMNKDLKILQSVDEDLLISAQKYGKEIEELENKLKSINKNIDGDEWLLYNSKLEKSREGLLNTIDQMDLSTELTKQLKSAVDDLSGGYDSFDMGRFNSLHEEARKVLRGLQEDVESVYRSLQDISLDIEVDLRMADIESSLKNLSDVESVKLEQGAYESAADSVLGLIQRLTELSTMPDRLEFHDEIKQSLLEMEKLTGVEIPVEDILIDLDEDKFESRINEIINYAEDAFSDFQRRSEDLGKIAEHLKIQEFSDINIKFLDTDELKEINSELENFIKNIGGWDGDSVTRDWLRLMSSEQRSFVSDLRGDYYRGEGLFHEIKDEIDIREQLEDNVNALEDFYGELASIADVPPYEIPILTDDLEKDFEILKNAINDVMDDIFSASGITVDNFDNLDEVIVKITETKNNTEELFTALRVVERSMEAGELDSDVFSTFTHSTEEAGDVVSNLINLLKEVQSIQREQGIRDLINQEEINLLSNYDRQIEQINNKITNFTKLKKEAKESGFNDTVEDLKGLISSLGLELDKLEFSPILSAWEDISREVNNLTDQDLFKFVLMPEGDKDEVTKRAKIINQAINDIAGDNLDFDSEREFKNYIDNLQLLEDTLLFLGEKYKEDIDLVEVLNLDELNRHLIKSIEEFENFEEIISKEELLQIIDDKQLDQMDSLSREIEQTKRDLERFEDLEDIAKVLDFDEEQLLTIKNIIQNIEESYISLKGDQEKIKLFEDIGFNKLQGKFEDFDLTELLNIKDAIKESVKLNNLLSLIRGETSLGRIIDFTDIDISDFDEIEELEVAIISALEEIDKFIEDSRYSWQSAISQGISDAIENISEDDIGIKRTAKLFTSLMNSMVRNLDMEVIEDSIGSAVDNIGNIFDLSDSLSDGLKSGMLVAFKSLESDSSLARQLSTVGGAIIGGILGGGPVGTQLGASLGNLTGQISEGLIGESVNVEEMEFAKNLNKQIKDAEDSIQRFGIVSKVAGAQFDNTANDLERFFGKDVWDIQNLEEAQGNLESLERMLNRMEGFASGAISDIGTALSDSLSRLDFQRKFEETIGQQLQNVIIDSIVESYAIEQAMDELAGLAEGIIDREGKVDTWALNRFRQASEEYLHYTSEMWDEISDTMSEINNVDSPNINHEQRFSAGSTTSITYRNHFSVNAQAFAGNRGEAEEFAKMLAPLIRQQLERESRG